MTPKDLATLLRGDFLTMLETFALNARRAVHLRTKFLLFARQKYGVLQLYHGGRERTHNDSVQACGPCVAAATHMSCG